MELDWKLLPEADAIGYPIMDPNAMKRMQFTMARKSNTDAWLV